MTTKCFVDNGAAKGGCVAKSASTLLSREGVLASRVSCAVQGAGGASSAEAKVPPVRRVSADGKVVRISMSVAGAHTKLRIKCFSEQP